MFSLFSLPFFVHASIYGFIDMNFLMICLLGPGISLAQGKYTKAYRAIS